MLQQHACMQGCIYVHDICEAETSGIAAAVSHEVAADMRSMEGLRSGHEVANTIDRRPTMKITMRKEDFDAIYRHALAERPDEACGLIAGVDLEDGTREIRKVYFLTNVDHTNEHFTIDPREQLGAIKDMRANGIKPLGNWHSHPESPSRPSEEDKRLANDSSASYLILSLMEEGNPVLNAFHVEGPEGERTVRKEELVIIQD